MNSFKYLVVEKSDILWFHCYENCSHYTYNDNGDTYYCRNNG